jgi:SAM-dependent methyltransferase
MRLLDKILMRWRFRQALRWVATGADVLDVGCHQGEFFRHLGERLGSGVGFDPLAVTPVGGKVRLIAEPFHAPSPLPDGSFDAAVLLATLEHIPDKGGLPAELYRLLRPGGRAVLTVPSPRVDAIVGALRWLRLVDGMSLEEHHGFSPGAVPGLFAPAGFELEHHARFQLGLNHLFVFRKPGTPTCPVARGAG